MSRRVARVARHALHWSADAFGNVSGLLTARPMPIFARSSSTHAGTTLRSFWTSTLPLDTLFGIASGTGGGCDERQTHGVYGLARGVLIGARAGTLPAPDASQPPAP